MASPEFEALYQKVTDALQELSELVRRSDLEEVEYDPEEYEEEKLHQSNSIMGHWTATVSYIGIDTNGNTKNSIYNYSSPSADALTSLGLYKAGLLKMERCI